MTSCSSAGRPMAEDTAWRSGGQEGFGGAGALGLRVSLFVTSMEGVIK